MIILDMGSGETCRNDQTIIKRMIDSVKGVVGERRDIILKWQLFKQAEDKGKSILPLMPVNFDYAHKYADSLGLMTTASIFDPESLEVIVKYKVPFVKIANNLAYMALIGYLPRAMPVYYSVGNLMLVDYIYRFINSRDVPMMCVSEYPATLEKYEAVFNGDILRSAVSDHTEGLDLYKKYRPMIWEKHFKLIDSIGPDAGSFAITDKELKEVMEL